MRQGEELCRPEALKRQLRHLAAGLERAINLGKIPANEIPMIRARIQEARELLGVAVPAEAPVPPPRTGSGGSRALGPLAEPATHLGVKT